VSLSSLYSLAGSHNKGRENLKRLNQQINNICGERCLDLMRDDGSDAIVDTAESLMSAR
jgi:hypothetical protein